MKNQKETSKLNKYPYLGKRKDQDLVVLFVEENKGIVVLDPDEAYGVGFPCERRFEGFFEPFDGQIILENKQW